MDFWFCLDSRHPYYIGIATINPKPFQLLKLVSQIGTVSCLWGTSITLGDLQGMELVFCPQNVHCQHYYIQTYIILM